MSEPEYTGKDVSYYLVKIESPKRLEPYDAECEDIIEALGMTFAEGCAFKAIWRKCAARTLGVSKAGYKGGLYDAEKAQYYGARMVAAELRLEALTRATPHAQTVPSPRTADSEPASEIDDTRPDIVASSHGDGGEHYDQAEIDRKAADYEKLERWKGAPEWAGVLLRDGNYKIWAQAHEDGAVWGYVGEPVSDEPLDADSWCFVESRPCAN